MCKGVKEKIENFEIMTNQQIKNNNLYNSFQFIN
jgi:hypothetical protein